MIPAVTSYVRELTDTALAKKALSDAIPTSVEEDLITSLSNKLVCFNKRQQSLRTLLSAQANMRAMFLLMLSITERAYSR